MGKTEVLQSTQQGLYLTWGSAGEAWGGGPCQAWVWRVRRWFLCVASGRGKVSSPGWRAAVGSRPECEARKCRQAGAARGSRSCQVLPALSEQFAMGTFWMVVQRAVTSADHSFPNLADQICSSENWGIWISKQNKTGTLIRFES